MKRFGPHQLAVTVIVTTAFFALAGCAGNPQPTEPAAPPVPDRAQDVEPLSVGDTAPSTVLRTADDESLDLATLYRQRPTMLVFYRGGWCPYCSEQLAQLAQANPTLADMGIQIFAISPDRPAALRQSPIESEQHYELLSDNDMTLAKAFGLAFRVPDETVEQYLEFGINLTAVSGRTHQLLPVPAVYLIDRDGVIRFAHWEADYTDRLSANALIDAAQRIVP